MHVNQSIINSCPHRKLSGRIFFSVKLHQFSVLFWKQEQTLKIYARDRTSWLGGTFIIHAWLLQCLKMTNVIHYFSRSEKNLMILLINAEKTFDKLLYVPKINMDSLCETVILLRCVQPKGVKTCVCFF